MRSVTQEGKLGFNVIAFSRLVVVTKQGCVCSGSTAIHYFLLRDALGSI